MKSLNFVHFFKKKRKIFSSSADMCIKCHVHGRNKITDLEIYSLNTEMDYYAFDKRPVPVKIFFKQLPQLEILLTATV